MILSAFKFLFSNTASYLLKECLDSKSIKMMIFKVILDGFDTKMSKKKKKKTPKKHQFGIFSSEKHLYCITKYTLKGHNNNSFKVLRSKLPASIRVSLPWTPLSRFFPLACAINYAAFKIRDTFRQVTKAN
jgi:hypothetical protein